MTTRLKLSLQVEADDSAGLLRILSYLHDKVADGYLACNAGGHDAEGSFKIETIETVPTVSSDRLGNALTALDRILSLPESVHLGGPELVMAYNTAMDLARAGRDGVKIHKGSPPGGKKP